MKRHEAPGMEGLKWFEYAGTGTYHFCAADRCEAIKKLHTSALREVLDLPEGELQRTVRTAAERRLRKLEREGR